MNIEMIGIDYNVAEIDVREKFSFTKSKAVQFMKKLNQEETVLGCVLLSTCNRVECWVSVTENAQIDLVEKICFEKGLARNIYASKFQVMQDEKAVLHLFYLTAGLKSQIMGEDQILMQVKDALSLARDAFCTNQVLEVLFRMAITAGKEIKTKLKIAKSNPSAPQAALSQLRAEGYHFSGKKCLLIGNGVMGKLTAQLLLDEKADVTGTIRKYKHGNVDMPDGMKRIDYEERYAYITECDYIISATASPNTTIKKEQLEKLYFTKEKVFVDLAVPRDIDLEIQKLPYVKVYDMDYFKVDQITEELQEVLMQADVILHKYKIEYENWYQSKDLVPHLMSLSKKAAKDVRFRIEKSVRKVVAETERDELENVIEQATQKVINKIMFEMRDTMNVETFRDCVGAMENLYESEG